MSKKIILSLVAIFIGLYSNAQICTGYISSTFSGTTNIFNSYISSPITISSYDWNFGDGSPHATIPNPTHNYADTNEYFVCLVVTGIDSLGQTVTCDFCINIKANGIPTSIWDLNKSKDLISLFPSPVFNQVNFVLPENGQFSYTIFDAVGNIVQNGDLVIHRNARTSLQISSLSSDIYFITIQGQNKLYKGRFVKQ